MTSTSILSDEMTEAARWHLFARLFERPIPGWHGEVHALATEMTDPILRAVAEQATALDEGGYLASLGPGGRVSPREAGHCGWRDPGWVLSDLARYYEAFGYRPRGEDPLDHVAVEVGFVAYLHLKEALALANEDDEGASVTREARDAFVREHLATLVVSLSRRLTVEDGHLAAAMDLLAARVPMGDVSVSSEERPDPLDAGCNGCG
jgi:hypothetical protein